MACRILKEAEVDLRSVIHSLAGAEPEKLEGAQRLLERMAGSLGEIEAAVRRDSSLPIRSALLDFHSKLAQAGRLSATVLDSIDRRAMLAGLASHAPQSKVYTEG